MEILWTTFGNMGYFQGYRILFRLLPFKVLALKTFPKFSPGKNASKVANVFLSSVSCVSYPVVVELLGREYSSIVLKDRCSIKVITDMEFVQKFTPPDFRAKNFTPSISPNFNSFSKKKHNKWVKMEKFTPLAKILHWSRHWQHGQIPPLFGTLLNRIR